jgi:hypothetical protein
MTDDQKIDILKLVYVEESKNLQFETTTAQNLVRYFITVELLYGAWIAGVLNITDRLTQCMLFGLNVLFGVCIAVLLHRNYLRRKEVVTPIRKALKALKLTEPGEYLSEDVIHRYNYNASWRNWYFVLIALFCVAQALPIFILNNTN